MNAVGKKWVYWDEKVSTADMDRLWMQVDVKREWLKSGETVGKVRFARDSDLKPYLTRLELKVNTYSLSLLFDVYVYFVKMLLCLRKLLQNQ